MGCAGHRERLHVDQGGAGCGGERPLLGGGPDDPPDRHEHQPLLVTADKRKGLVRRPRPADVRQTHEAAAGDPGVEPAREARRDHQPRSMAGNQKTGRPGCRLLADSADAPGDLRLRPGGEPALAEGEPLGDGFGLAGDPPLEGIGLDGHRKDDSGQAAVVAHGRWL